MRNSLCQQLDKLNKVPQACTRPRFPFLSFSFLAMQIKLVVFVLKWLKGHFRFINILQWFWGFHDKLLQLFRERLSNKTVRDNAEWYYGEWWFMLFDWGFRCFRDIEGNSTNKRIYACSFPVGKHLEPQSINAKLFLPIIPIDIVAYAFTLFGTTFVETAVYLVLFSLYPSKPGDLTVIGLTNHLQGEIIFKAAQNSLRA